MASLRNLTRNLVLVVVSLMVGGLGLEGAARVYVAEIAQKHKLFAPDAELGWVPLSHLDVERLNVDGETWRIVTGADGVRGPADWPDHGRRLLVLGDSFAFGEGVDLDERFDRVLQRRVPDLSVVNLGVMGYGPDQELIRARRWSGRLRAGDVLLLLTFHGNDFDDLARTRHAGRPKPWLEEQGDRLIEHPPALGWMALLRDRSLVVAKAMRSVATLRQSDRTERRLRVADRLYRKLVLQEARPLLARDVLVVIAHHGAKVKELPFDLPALFAGLCPEVSACLDLDPALAERPRSEVFLSDGHWAPGGHRIAADEIAGFLRGPSAQVARGGALPSGSRSREEPVGAPAEL